MYGVGTFLYKKYFLNKNVPHLAKMNLRVSNSIFFKLLRDFYASCLTIIKEQQNLILI